MPAHFTAQSSAPRRVSTSVIYTALSVTLLTGGGPASVDAQTPAGSSQRARRAAQPTSAPMVRANPSLKSPKIDLTCDVESGGCTLKDAAKP